MTAKLNIIVDEIQDVMTVPYDAISTNASGDSVVYIVEGGMPGMNRQSAQGDRTGAAGSQQNGTAAGGIEAGASAAITGTVTPTIAVGDAADAPVIEQREVVVEVGMESDYYTQIISDELSAGMTVVIPSAAGEGGSTESSMTLNLGGMGGGMGGGGGAPGGGGPGGGGMP